MPSLSIRPSPTITPEPTLLVAEPIFPPEPWPEAVIPDGRLVRTASVRVDDVDVRITLDANPLIAGKPAWVTTELTNLGPDKLHWTADGCGTHVGVWGFLPDLQWRPGAPQAGLAAKFKESALSNAQIAPDSTVSFGFAPDWAVRQGLGAGEYGCADIGIGTELRPGRRFQGRMQWDGFLFRDTGYPPSARADIIGTFGAGWNRASDGADRRREAIVVHLTAWITGVEAAPALSVGEAVDVALTHDGFAEWVKARYERTDKWQSVTKLDPATGMWQIGLAQYPGGDTRIVVVDPTTGQPTAYLRATIDGSGNLTNVGPAD